MGNGVCSPQSSLSSVIFAFGSVIAGTLGSVINLGGKKFQKSYVSYCLMVVHMTHKESDSGLGHAYSNGLDLA